MNWKQLETCLFESARAVLEDVLAKGDSPLYTAAFYGSYREDMRVISLPFVGANSLGSLEEEDPEGTEAGFAGTKWNPVEWEWGWSPNEYGNAVMSALEEDLQAYANRGGPVEWEKAESRFIKTVVSAAKALGKYFATDPRVCKDFVVFFHDSDIDLVRSCISTRLFRKHFPEEVSDEKTRRHVAELPLTEQAAFYMGRLRKFEGGISHTEAETWLISHGEVAFPLLIEGLGSQDIACSCVMILGWAGVADIAVIEALRHHL